MDMKKISSVISLSVLVLFLLVFSVPLVCFSEPDSKVWEYFGVSSVGGFNYYNKTNITKSSNIISVWVYTSITDDERKEFIEKFKESNLEKSIKYQHYDHNVNLWEIDCENRQFKIDTVIHYDDSGSILFNEKNTKTCRSNIPPQSIIENLYKKVCVTPKKPLKK
jgi:hypothetical protein